MARSRSEVPAKFAQVLEYMDGPQVVLLERSTDFKIIAVAIDRPGELHPFFGAAISFDQWDRYRRGMLDLRYLLMYPRWRQWFIFNLKSGIDGAIELRRVPKDKRAEEEYIPDPGFFSYDHSEPIKYSNGEAQSTQKYVTDGVWDLPDFTEFYNRLTDIYAFSLALKKYPSTDVSIDDRSRIRESFAGHPLRGGSSYVNLYSDLASSQSLDERIHVGRLQYASAGHVDVRGRLDVFVDVKTTFDKFQNAYEDIKRQYKGVHEFLRRNRLLKADADRFENNTSMALYIHSQGEILAKAMSLQDIHLIYELTGNNALKFTKIILSYFRRMERYFIFFAEGRVKDPEIVETG